MSDKPRRCRSVHPDDPTMQCQGEVTELTMHVEDHWHQRDGKIIRWPVIRMPEWNPALAAVPAANPDRVKGTGCSARLTRVGEPMLHCTRPSGHSQDHRAGFINWTEAVAAYPEVAGSARDQQVGGDHYRKHAIQVWDIVDEYGLSYYAGQALKYLLRAGEKGPRAEDLKKARHVLDRMIEKEE